MVYLQQKRCIHGSPWPNRAGLRHELRCGGAKTRMDVKTRVRTGTRSPELKQSSVRACILYIYNKNHASMVYLVQTKQVLGVNSLHCSVTPSGQMRNHRRNSMILSYGQRWLATNTLLSMRRTLRRNRIFYLWLSIFFGLIGDDHD